MSTLIEQCLRRRGSRYFRGHHEGEFFFLVDTLADSRRARLHVHLRPSPDGTVTVNITADRFYPAAHKGALGLLAARWQTALPELEIDVHDSIDPALVGVRVGGTRCPSDGDDLRAFIDAALAEAAEFFRAAAAPFPEDRARRSA